MKTAILSCKVKRLFLPVSLIFFLLITSIPLPSVAAAKYEVSVNLSKKTSKKTVSVQKGSKIQIVGLDGSKTIAKKKLKYSSSNKDVAKVSSKGLVTTKNVGKAVITISTKNGKKKAKLTLKVVSKKVAVKKVTLNSKSLSLKKGETSKLTATITPETATDQKITWTSSNETVASVSEGMVKAVGPGAATITATVAGKTAYCNITVVDDEKPSDGDGDSGQSGSSDSGGDSGQSGSSDTGSDSGQGGSSDASDGSGQSGNAGQDQNTSIKVTAISLNPASASIAVNGTVSIVPTITPSNATDKSVSYKTSDSSIATVTNGGVVTGIKPGKATITVSANDGSGVSKNCDITVTEGNLEASGTDGPLTWNLYKTSETPTYTLVVSGNGAMPDHNGSWENAPKWKHDSTITKVVIEGGVTKIGKCAFDQYSNLKTIELNEGLITIEENAFAYDIGLEGILTIPSTVTTIADDAFVMTGTIYSDTDCGITGISFANGSRLETIGDRAFEGMGNLTGEIAFPDSLKTIGIRAFSLSGSTKGFTKISFGANSQLEILGDNAFYGHKNLAYIEGIPATLQTLGSGWQEMPNLTATYRGTQAQYAALLTRSGATEDYHSAWGRLYYDGYALVYVTFWGQ